MTQHYEPEFKKKIVRRENMQKIRINSVSEYINELEKLGIENYIYRGQNEPYFGIKANGFRPYMGGENSDKIYNIDEISQKYYEQIISKLTPEEKEYFLVFCQHYGVPTNLVDFSYSPLIALFFACQGKKDPKFTLSELVGNSTVDDLKKNVSTRQMLIDNLINKLEKPTLSPYAQVYLLNKKWLLDITDVLMKVNHNNFFESIYSNGNVRIELINGFINLFNGPEIDSTDISDCLIQLIECYRENNVDFFGDNIEENINDHEEDYYEEDDYEDLFIFQKRLKEEQLHDVMYSLYTYVYHEMEDERIPYESDIFDHHPEYANEVELSAAVYILLLANLIQIFHNDKDGRERLILNLKVYFTYQPANLFDRINAQKGLFVYQPYFYSYDETYDYNILSVQNINPDITIEINNYQAILSELDALGINLGGVYGDLDNIAKSVVYSYKRKNKM